MKQKRLKLSSCAFFFLLTCSVSLNAQNQNHSPPLLLLKNGAQQITHVTHEAAALAKTSLNFDRAKEAASFDNETYLILQFDHILTHEARLQLLQSDIHLHEYIPHNAYLARLPKETALKTLTDHGLVGYFRPEPQNKMSPHFYEQVFGSDNDTHMKIVATFTGNVSQDRLRSALATISKSQQIEFKARFRYFIAEMTAREIRELAELPFVTSVGLHSDEVTFDAPRDHDPYFESSHGDVHNELVRTNVIKSSLPGYHSLSGEGVVVGVGDNVYQGPTHVDMQGRHHILDPGESNNGTFSDHGNHTSGTVGGNGARRPRFAGIAPKATIYTARTGEIFTLGLEATDPMVISSNSWTNADRNFSGFLNEKGRYNIYSQEIDQLLYEEKKLLSVHSAGNSGATQPGYPPNYLMINPSYGSAKNTLVVARYVPFPATGSGLLGSNGPTRDGRVKPDVVANTSVYATVAHHDYASKGGSSMSTPAVSGVAALLHQRYRQINNDDTPDGALVKATLMNSADYVVQQGPAYDAGFGRVNARRAVEIIDNQQFKIDSVQQGESQTFSIDVPAEIGGKAIAQMKIMLYWTDPEASPYASPALVNNLDLSVAKGGQTFLPWVLDTTAANVDQPATKGVDTINNTEQVAIDNPMAGSYQATISGTAVPFGPQTYYVVYSFVLDELVITHPIGGEKLFSGQRKVIFWDTQHIGEDSFIDEAEYSIDGGASWTSFYRIFTNKPSAFPWTLPDLPLTEVLVRIGHTGRTATSMPFTISPPIALVQTSAHADSMTFSWNPVDGATSFDLLQLVNNDEWQVFMSLADTSLALAKSQIPTRDAWFSVQAVDASNAIRSQRSDAIFYVASNAPPVARQDSVSTPVNLRVFVDVLANDSDSDGDALFITEVTGSSNGTANLFDNQMVEFRPATGFTGADTFFYKITDGHGGMAEGFGIVMVGNATSLAEADLPLQFTLEQNYPNPFNPETTIRYSLAQAGNVRLTIFDVLGRKVKILVDKNQPAGRYDVIFNGESFASGLYFYRLEASDFISTRRLLLVK